MKKLFLITLIAILLVGCSNDNKSSADSTNTTNNSEDTLVENDTIADENNNVISNDRMNLYTADDNGYCANFDVVKFGSYEQDGDESNGTEAIEWYVIAKEDGKALLLSKYILDEKEYNHETTEDITWENCELRVWLNNDFYGNAFDDEEKQHIQTTELINQDNPAWDTVGGNNTIDNVFILSIDEIAKYFSFVYEDAKGRNYDYASEDLYSTATAKCTLITAPYLYEYTEAIFSELSNKLSYTNNTPVGTIQPAFWVRSPGGRRQYDVCMCVYGYINEDQYCDCSNTIGVRPAIWVDEVALSMYQ